ncbi:MAG: hypothetical protein NDI94_02755 [Candidatus Woesearchaeota archaeon]|nr:hypothetical protein [Candidatus Woesearchaeota archaeon]
MHKRVLLAVVVLIFLLFTSYNISSYIVAKRYQKSSYLNLEIAELKEMVKNNQTLYEKLDKIDRDVQFLNAMCFKD